MRPVSSLPCDEAISVAHPSDVIVVQTRTNQFAQRLGFSRVTACAVATAASEAASNIVKYGRQGYVHLRARFGPPICLEFEATDQGDGIPDVELAMRDGISEGQELAAQETVRARQSLGCGLGAIQRLMDRMQIVTSSTGTSVRAEKELAARPETSRQGGGGPRAGR